MTLSLFNEIPLTLVGGLSSSALELYHGSSALTNHDNEVFVELSETSSGTNVQVRDFVLEETTHELHAWELVDDDLVKWSRATAGSASGVRTDMNSNVIVVAVPTGVAVPTEPPTSGPPAPGTTQKTVKIRISQDGLPYP